MAPKYVVEHMEDGMHEWCQLEYKHMLSRIGADNLYFSGLTETTLETMPEDLKKAHCHSTDVLSLPGITLDQVCLLDPAAKEPLAPEDADRFTYFLFGGILGDDPPRDRTGELRKLGFANRHLGPVQMTTDTAVNVTRTVLEDKVPLDQIPYIDHPEIKFSKKESVIMPFRYIAVDKQVIHTPTGERRTVQKPLMPPGMFELLKKDNEASFEF
ncbi:hypothetical protein BZG36_01749 [Bifiguratus adelaidae]|uniref:Protein arginine N-methyltransferase SFM1 n=1 Tax=Bifiguratus adelaidae TaxID=1938954 RepID=A0A261Y329_9FUNG|nr:hypothetical protein BZG36_01749 [Bifiguratus adelaidae]